MNRREAAVLARQAKAEKAPPLDVRFWSKVSRRSDDECWPWTASVRKEGQGYGAFWYQGRHHPAPRIAYFLAVGVFANDLQICHRCDNPSCCNPRHLFLGTNKQNNDDKVAKKRHAFGVANGNSKLTEGLVIEIREARKNHTLKQLETMYGVDFTTISDICRRKSWKHVA